MGPTLDRPHVDVVHGSRVDKLKEARIDRGTRVLFAFDSSRNAVMLVGGDKSGKWNRWYPPMIRLAEKLYAEHERSMGKEVHCPSRREAQRTLAPENEVNHTRAAIYERLMEAQQRIAHALYRRGVTHEAVLAALDAVDGSLSDGERSEDLYLSALEPYVEALGGRLEVQAVFGEEPIIVRRWPDL